MPCCLEVGEPTIRRELHDLKINEESRDKAKIREKACKQIVARRYNSKTKPRAFQEGDLVWRMKGEARKVPTEGKFNANWEGLFKVRENLQNGAYRLEQLNGQEVPKTWNASHLKMYFS